MWRSLFYLFLIFLLGVVGWELLPALAASPPAQPQHSALFRCIGHGALQAFKEFGESGTGSGKGGRQQVLVHQAFSRAVIHAFPQQPQTE